MTKIMCPGDSSKNPLVESLAVLLFTSAMVMSEDGFHVMMGFSGNVRALDGLVFLGGWEEGKKPDYGFQIFLDGSSAQQKLLNEIEKLNQLHAEFKASRRDADEANK